MEINIRFTRFTILVLLIHISGVSFAKTSITGLRCEYLCNPLGMNVANPRLSWLIESSEANVNQTACEIRVATSVELLRTQRNLVWSTGKVNSDQSVNLEYKGPSLESKTRYFWQVRIWDNKGKSTDWSTPAWWETALLEPSLWKADWIFATGKTPGDHRPVYFRKEFSINKKIRSARLYISSLGLYQAFINGVKVSADLFTPGWTSFNKRIQYQTYDITNYLGSQNAIGAIVGDGW